MGVVSRGRKLVVTALLALTAAVTMSASASAGVPKADYGCYGEANTYIGTLKIKSAAKYSYLGESGKYSFKSGSKVLKFKTGPLKPWVGRLFKANGDPAIELVTDEAGGQTVNCYP